MDLPYYFPNMAADHISVEAHSDGFPFYSDQFDTPSDSIDSLFDTDPLISEMDIAGICDLGDLKGSITCPTEPNDLDTYLGPIYLSNFSFDNNDSLALINSLLPVNIIDKNKKAKSTKKQIPLSQSVGVGVPQRSLKASPKIEIVNDLEATFRPRYKSDYFAQNGKHRKPRYVTDRSGNHYITLKVPLDVRGQVRVDWLTVPTKSGERYLMPYQFQASNESSEIPDCNPIFVDIETDAYGTMKLYLVLIKSKQDALKSFQQLQPFHQTQNTPEVFVKKSSEGGRKLTPKQIIQKYQLEKSQLAFTLCPISINGKAGLPEWETTVYSTVLTEVDATGPALRTVVCPNCSQSVHIPSGDDDNIDQEITVNKRKQLQTKSEKPKTIKKQKSLPENIYQFN